jgi:trk system potassium uptake protein TrkA
MHILIIGAGDIGFQLAKRLSQQNHDITMIEANAEKMTRASEQLDALVIYGNGASYRVLEQTALEKMGIVAAMTDRDEVNLMACRLAKKLGVPTTIARVRNPQFTQPDFLLTSEEMGTDMILHPEKAVADAAVHLIRNANTAYAVEFESGRIELLGLRLTQGSPLLNIPLRYLSGEMDDLHFRVVAINRNYKTLIPNGNDILVPGDQIFVVGDHKYRELFLKKAGIEDKRMHNVMVLGGGLIGRFIGLELQNEVNLKIIEKDINRARELSEILPNALIIHGNGTDFDLLTQEGLSEMDAFVAVSGTDETNIITTLLAQHSNVRRAIAMINKAEYVNISPRLGLDAVVSKQSMTVSAVQRFIQQQEVASIAGLPGVEAQVIEYVVGDACRIIRQPLKDSHFPRHAIVGAVLRGDDLLVPHGDTHLQPGDKAVVFTLPDAYTSLEQLFCAESKRSRLSRWLGV